jgi:hypothetical protein
MATIKTRERRFSQNRIKLDMDFWKSFVFKQNPGFHTLATTAVF